MMKWSLTFALGTVLALTVFGCGDGTDNPMPGTDQGIADRPDPLEDSDSDSIPDVVEGWPDRDTDGDGAPDFQDTDADGDSIFDRVEAGDADLGTAPVDSDEDGTPDYLDDDSDDNGLIDRIEGDLDFEGDGIPDFADPDDDDDRISDIIEIGEGDFPRDTDADGNPDFRDFDSDGDFILDRVERGGMDDTDSDGDGINDYLDLDSDGDGLTDAEEAGDSDLETPPVDTDSDGLPDYLDIDSDSDGLRDDVELELGSDPTLDDSDGDGVSDVIEVGAGTDPNDAADNPRVRGDFVFTVPFREPADPPRDTIRFRTNIRRLDAYFLFDVTGSMSGEISAMRARTIEILDRLQCESSNIPCTGDLGCAEGEICSFDEVCIQDPDSSGCIPDLWTGVGKYAGQGNSYRNLISIQPDAEQTRDAVPGVPDFVGDREALYEAVGCAADPTACFGAVCARPDEGIGCPAFRRDAVRLLVGVTDDIDNCNNPQRAPNDEPCTIITSAGAAGGRLNLTGIRFLGIDADGANRARPALRALSVASNTLDSNGDPFYFEGDGSAVADAVVDGISQIASELSLFVDIEVQDLEGDDGDALQFVQRLEINTTNFGCSDPGAYADTNSDGFDDAFSQLETGVAVCWDVLARSNSRVRQLPAAPQVFQAQLTVFGDGSPLDSRRVFFLVPPDPRICGPDDTRPECQ